MGTLDCKRDAGFVRTDAFARFGVFKPRARKARVRRENQEDAISVRNSDEKERFSVVTMTMEALHGLREMVEGVVIRLIPSTSGVLEIAPVPSG